MGRREVQLVRSRELADELEDLKEEVALEVLRGRVDIIRGMLDRVQADLRSIRDRIATAAAEWDQPPRAERLP